MGPCFSRQAQPNLAQRSGMQLTQPKPQMRKTSNLRQGQSTKMQDYNPHQKEIEQQKKELKKRQAQLNQKANQLKELKDSMQKKIRNLEQQQIRIEEKSKQPQTEVSVEKMIKQEDLFPIQGRELQGLLHRSIGAITFLNKHKQRHMGSGVLISKNVVLTAAHNVFSRIEGEEYEDYKVYFGADGVAKDYYEVEAIRYPEQYKTCKKNQVVSFDYALLKLSKQVSYNQFPKVCLGCPKCLIQKNKENILLIFGFPGNYSGNYKPLDKFHNQIQLTQFGMALKNRIIAISPQQHKICYGISTLPGQSGCPVMIDEQIIALHVGGGKADQQFNIGRLIDISMVNRLWDWCKQLNCHPFLIEEDNLCVHLTPILKQYLKEKQERINKQTTIKLQLYNKQLKQIDVSENTNLTELNLSNNQLSAIDVTKNTNLTHLYLSNNQLSAIDVSKNTNLTHLYLSDNRLSSIDVTKNTNLNVLYFSNNRLSAIDVTKNTNLTLLYLSNNQLSAIDVTKNTKLALLWLQNNCLETVSLSFVASKPIQQYLDSFLSNFSDQSSAVCEILIHYNSADKSKCIQLKEEWAKKYQQNGVNKHKCMYKFSVVER